MNLWLRLIWLVLTVRLRGRLEAPLGVSRLRFRVWPHDLDTSLHMNNGRYWTLMDLGRTDLMLRLGLWRAWLRHGWTPVITAGTIRYRRELKPFQQFTLETRVLCWEDTFLVMEHRMVTRGANGHDVTHAVALVRGGLYDRKSRAFVRIEQLMAVMGISAGSPPASPEVRAFLAAESAMRKAG